jgi:F-type H+-transporting ATPase subunit b
MLNLDVATIAFQVINFLALSALLYYLLFRPVMRTMKDRAAEKKRLAREIAQEREEAARLRTELEARLVHAEEEAEAIIAEAQEQGEADRKALLQEAHTEAERLLVDAHTDVQRLHQQAVDDFHDDLLDAVLEISGQAIAHAAPPEVHDALVQELSDSIWELGRDDMQRVETFRRSLGDRAPTAYVRTAQPLSAEQQGLLARTFTALADRHVNLEVQTDPALAAGLRVRIGDVVVESSIAGQLAELRETVSGALEERLADE